MEAIIECSGYKNNQFVFLTSSNVSSPVQTLNFVNNDQTLSILTLESIQGCPKQQTFSKCSYSESTGSIYAAFKSNPIQNTSFYEVKIGEKNASFTNLNLTINSTDISAFVFAQGLNNAPYLSYISNDTLNFRPFDNSNSTMQVALLQQKGHLLSGRNDTHIFFINENGFTQYDVANKTMQQITASTGISPESDTKGQVISIGLEDYMIFRKQNKMYIIQHTNSLSNYTAINSKLSSAHFQTVSPSSIPTSTSTAVSMKATENSTQDVALPLMAISINNNNLNKRSSITTTNKSNSIKVKRQAINDGNAISATTYNMTDSNIVAMYAVSNTSERLPLDIKILSLNGNSGYLLDTMSGDQILQGMSTSNSTTESLTGDRNLSKGSIAGIVVGVCVSLIIVGVALLFHIRRKRKELGVARHIVHSREIDSEKCSLKDFKDFSHTTSCSYDPKNMIYIDGRPDITPLRYVQNVIDFADLSGEELQQVEPEAQEKLVLFGGLYISPASESLKEYNNGYAMRDFSTSYGQLVTVHYFNENLLKSFIHSAYALSSFTLPSPHMVKHMRAIVLSQPTPKNKYRYIWITSPVKPKFSLYNTLLAAVQIDKTDINFQIWSVYSMMKSIEALHSHDFVHANITLDAFFYEDPNEVTDWKLYGFDYTLKENNVLEAYNFNSFSAPELLILDNNHIAKKELDIWSLGCTISTLVTGKLLFESVDQVKSLHSTDALSAHLEEAFKTMGHINATFEQITRLMLQVLPENRKNITEVIQLWDQVYNMS